MKLVVQIPAFNEEATIARALAVLPSRVATMTGLDRSLFPGHQSGRIC